MNGYDFDKTIYKKNSSVEFYLFLIRKRPYLIYHLFVFIIVYIMYKLKLTSKINAKEKMFSILKKVKSIDELVNEFWKNRSLNEWYIQKKQNNDVVISASPYFLLLPICKKNNIKYLIATSVDKKTGKITSKNCYGEEKSIQFKNRFNNIKLDSFYTDSYSDSPMLQVSNKVIIVKKGQEKEVLE